MVEQGGGRIAAVSYDSRATLETFARKYAIGFPLLSDRESAVIRRFGIFNANIAPDLRAYGVPHPVEYLISPDGIVVRKYFVPNYQHRVTASAVALREFGAPGEKALAAIVRSGAVTIELGLASATAFAGQEIAYFANFTIAPGWHIYAEPLPDPYAPTSIVFDDPKIIQQSFELAAEALTTLTVLGEKLPVYSGSFRGTGLLLLKFPLDAGEIKLSGKVRFQQCGDTVCEPPETIPFELGVTLGTFVVAH
jgi:hypothetical protein